MSIILYMLVTPALFYLGSRAMITAPLWNRYPPRLARFADCSACSGTWYGVLMGTFGGYYLGLPFLGLDGDSPVTVGAVALCSMTWTPIIAAFVQWGFETLGSAVQAEALPLPRVTAELLDVGSVDAKASHAQPLRSVPFHDRDSLHREGETE